MDLALYHPTAGYYMRDREKIGPAGDFYTSSDVSPLFGKVLADQMEEMWRLSGSPDHWVLLEFGAGKGILARDILNHIAAKHPVFSGTVSYIIIEKSPSMVERQKSMLAGACPPGRGVSWLGGIEELRPGPVNGCFFSNELLDSFPVHRVMRDGGRLKEIYVACKNGRLMEVTDSLSRPELSGYISEFQVHLEDGQVIEINLAMRDWLKDVAGAMNRGFLLTIDYGDIAGRLHRAARPGGTIRSYRRHRFVDDLYEEPGGQDITASVNFTALFRWGEEASLYRAGYAAQMYFLMNLGIMDYLNAGTPGREYDPSILKETMAVKKLVMPEGMGSAFKVAAQYKGFDKEPSLTGFRGRFGSRA
ncbi:MAG: class I SAM-dependent methyltransferase [Bacillota bacterium]